MYKIIGGDQKEYGPVGVEDIRQWIAEGRANGQTPVQMIGNTDWQPLASYPELAAALGSSPLPSAAPPPIPGASTALPADILDRGYDLDVGSCVSRAWKLVTDNFGIVVGGTAIYVLIKLAFFGLGYIPLLNILTGLLQLLIEGPLIGGVFYFLLKNIRRQSVEAGDIFSGFKLRFVQLMVTYLIQALISGLVALPGVIIAIFGMIPLFQDRQPDFLQIVLMAVGFIVMVIPVMYLSVCWIFSLPLVIDKNLDFWAALETSRKVVNKHWWMSFALLIVCGLITVASLLLCCLPLFFGIPLAMSVIMYAYEDIFGQRSAAKG